MNSQLEPTVKDLQEPKFITWLEEKYGRLGTIVPDPEDYWPWIAEKGETIMFGNHDEFAFMRTLSRLWKEWKANQRE
jgi:hypothetical protein